MTLTTHPDVRPWRPVHGMIALTLLTALVYAQVLSAPFLNWDDMTMLVENVDLRADHWPSVLSYWNPSRPHLGLYAPLTYSLYFALASVGRGTANVFSSTPFHAASLCLHVAGGWLIWAIVRRTTDAGWAGVAGAAVFLLHPVQVEPVAWIASMNTVLSTTLALAALYLYVRAVQTPRRALFIASCGVLVAAMFAKPSVIGAPLAALAIDRWILRSAWRPAIARALVWAIVVAPFAIVGRLAQPALPIVTPSWLGRAWVAMDIVGFDLARLIVPTSFAIDYGRTPTWALTFPATSIAFVALAIVALGATILIARRRPTAMAIAGVFLAGVAPVIGFVPFDFQGLSSVADRYEYWPMLGIAIGVAAALKGHRLARAPAVIGIVLLAVLSSVQAASWTSDAALFGQALRVNPTSAAALSTLAYLDVRRADRSSDATLRTSLYASARERYAAALRTRPADGKIRYGLANLDLRTGDFEAAASEFAIVATSNLANDPAVYVNWGITLAHLGRADEAVARFERATKLAPGSADAFANWGIVLLRRGDRVAAERQLRHALDLQPGHPQATAALERLHAGGG